MLYFDVSEFERRARELDAAADQIPFALANALTRAAFRTKARLAEETWPQHVQVRNKGFMKQALQIVPATKRNLTIEIFDRLGRANLKAHADSGTIRPQRARNLAIPPEGTVTRTARGIPDRQKPKAIIASTPKRALRITPKGIFVGQGGRLRLKYAFAPLARVKKDVPFREDFERFMRQELREAFPITMRKAMATRRPR
jgi:hypothetical protein